MLEDDQTMTDIRHQIDFHGSRAASSCISPQLGFSIGVCMMCLMVTLTLLVMATPKAHAATGASVVLRQNGFLSGNTVTVGDIFANAGDYAGHVLAPAPALGETLVLNTNDLMRIADAFDFNWRPQTRFETITLKRPVTAVKKSAIAQFVETAVKDEVGENRNIEVSIDSVIPALNVTGTKKPEFLLKSVHYSPVDGDFTIALDIRGNSDKTKSISLNGHVFHLTKIPVLTAPLKSGDIIRSSDLRYETVRQSALNQNVALTADDLIGMTPRRVLAADKPVRMSDLEQPKIVKKGDIITMVLKNGALLVTAKGKALDSGAKGTTIRVLNPASNRVIEARITAPGRASTELISNKI